MCPALGNEPYDFAISTCQGAYVCDTPGCMLTNRHSRRPQIVLYTRQSIVYLLAQPHIGQNDSDEDRCVLAWDTSVEIIDITA